MAQHGSSHSRQRAPRRALLARALVPVALVVAASLVVVGAARAALPPRGASFAFHDHDTAGSNWHVELRIDPKDERKIRTLVVYSQQCKGTVAKTGVAISDAGVIAASGGLKGGGWWEVNATFANPTTLVGTMRMRRADCDTGLLSYPNAITGDGHTGHSHSGGHDHGPKYPDFAGASLAQRKQARALHRRVLKTWTGITLTQAARRGWVQARGANKTQPGTFHTYNQRYEKDKRLLDARRPESLVFWRRADGESVILGPMFRVPAGERPAFAGPIPIYHSHGQTVKNRMTHVWLTKGPKMAWANCVPVLHLQQYNPAFTWIPGGTGQGLIGGPC